MTHTNFYEEHAKSCAPDDYWGQVKRTVNGQPIEQQQIDMIVAAIRSRLELRADDVLLDLCCGNGALTTLVLPHCAGGVGVDASPFLIAVAQRAFARELRERYVLADATEFVATTLTPEAFTVVLCYGSFMFLGEEILLNLRQRFPKLRRVFLGNLPDKALQHTFFAQGSNTPNVANDPSSSTGVWRHREEIDHIANRTGWSARFETMPAAFYASHYRYDVVLTPQDFPMSTLP